MLVRRHAQVLVLPDRQGAERAELVQDLDREVHRVLRVDPVAGQVVPLVLDPLVVLVDWDAELLDLPD